MKFAVLGMHRSGINAFSKWLIKQIDSKTRLKPYFSDWIELDEDKKTAFISQVNHPEHATWKEIAEENTHVLTVERENAEYFTKFSHEHGYTWGNAIIIVRDFPNWLASAYKMGGEKKVPDLDIQKYESHLKLFSHAKWCHLINYDLWFSSAHYRKEICDKLKLKFNDQGIDHVPANGGGSSFDGTRHNGRAKFMKVLERYKQYKQDYLYRDMIEEHFHIWELSNYWIMKGLE